MKTRIFAIFILSLCCLFGAIHLEAQPRAPKVHYRSMPAPPPPVMPGRMVQAPRIISPIGHVYGFSIPGRNIMFNFSPNGRVYREGDNIGSPFTIQGNLITVYSNRDPRRIIGTGKISRSGKHIDWMEFSNGARFRLRIIG